VALPTVVAAAADRLTIATEENPPFNMTVDGRVTGIAAERLKAALAEAGIDYTLGSYPWARAYNMALHDRNNCVFSTARIDQREAQFRWIGPLARNRWYVLARAGFDRQITGIEDLRRYRVAALNGSAVGLYLREKGVAVEEINEDRLIVKMMEAGRIDLWATSERGFYLSAVGIAPRARNVLVLREVDLYLACNLQTEGSLVDRLGVALARRASIGFSAGR
jgi:polar amino acid transport system substrate-binding protein